MSNLDRIVSVVSSSSKYRSLCPDTIRRVALREVEAKPFKNSKAAIKGTKRRLHQIYGAFEQALDYDHAYERLSAAYASGSESQIKIVCRDLLCQHSSTKERMADLEQFYPSIFRLTGQPDSILDLGCGLNPLTLPWMNLNATARYVALDIDRLRVCFLNRYLGLAGREPLARCQDLLVHPAHDDADLAILLKMSPTLERQERGGTARLLEALRAPLAVVSYAVTSLGGRDKGMQDQYQQRFLEMVADRKWRADRLAFQSELVFVVDLRT